MHFYMRINVSNLSADTQHTRFTGAFVCVCRRMFSHSIFFLWFCVFVQHARSPPVSSPPPVQFTCVLGTECILPLIAFDVPATPYIRVSDVECDQAVTSAVFTYTGAPTDLLSIGVLSDPRLTTASMYVCMASVTVADLNFSTQWATLDVLGPNPSLSTVCYFGSKCVPSLLGNKLTSTKSLVFYTAQSNLCSDWPQDDPILGLFNDPPSWIIGSSNTTGAYYDSMGFVDSELNVETEFKLCWAPYLNSATPIELGTLVLQGPIDRDETFSCSLGEPDCVITPSDAGTQIEYSSIVISDSLTLCSTYTSGIEWTDSTLAPLFDTGTLSYSIGSTSEANGMRVDGVSVCWRHNDISPYYTTAIGTFTMYGPTDDDNEIFCYSGIECTFEIPGIFEESSNLYVRESGCGNPMILDTPASGPTNPSTYTPGSKSFTANFEYTAGVGTEIGLYPLVLCWEHATTVDRIVAGSFVLYGPINLVSTLECLLSSVCTVSIGFILPSDDLVDSSYLGNQQLFLVESATNFYDPCNHLDAVTVSATSDIATYSAVANGVDFRFQSINTPVSTGVSKLRSVCWSLVDNIDRAVFLGEWLPVGPNSGMATTCLAGSTCQITISPYMEYDPYNLFFLTSNDADCYSTILLKTNAVPLTGGTNPATNVGGTAVFSFGSITGWTDIALASIRTFTICYSRSDKFRHGSPLGTLTLTDVYGG